MTSVSNPKAFNTNHSRVPKCLVIAGALVGFAFLGGCQPKSSSQTTSTAQSAQNAVAVVETSPAPTATERPRQAHETKVAPPQIAATRDAKSEDTVAGGKAMTIAGGWVNAGGACDSGASVFFNPDGTYMSEGEKGTWALAGKTLTVTTSSTVEEAESDTQGPEESAGDSGEKAVLTLLSLTDDTARVVLSNGNNASWTRCNS